MMAITAAKDAFRRVWLPYCVKKMSDEIGGWIVLNRGYKPLGGRLDLWVNYQEVPAWQRIKRITLSQQEKIDHGCRLASGWRPDEIVWLYHDGCIPTYSNRNWSAYSERLSVLYSLGALDGAYGYTFV
jgi:hypothetical protein